MFTGITAEGINRENAAALECTALCRDNKCKSLAIPETSILRLASQVPSPPHTAAAIVEHEPLEQAGCVFRRRETMDVEFRPPWKEIARGILPSLRHVVHREAKLVNGDVTKE
jgi:hypothetical protein